MGIRLYGRLSHGRTTGGGPCQTMLQSGRSWSRRRSITRFNDFLQVATSDSVCPGNLLQPSESLAAPGSGPAQNKGWCERLPKEYGPKRLVLADVI
jgi:hypothetical protein